MNVVDATAIIGAVTAVIGTLVLPPYFERRRKRREQSVDTGVSWAGLSNAIAKERDNWKAEAEKKDAELEAQEVAHVKELADVREAHRVENVEWARQLGECQAKVRQLYGELYELQRLLPPNLRPGPDNGVG